MRKLCFIILIVAGFQSGFAYPIIVEGLLIDKDLTGIANKEIQLSVHPNIPNFSYKNILITNENGHFADTIRVPNTLTLGWLILSYFNCDSTRISRRIAINQNKRHHQVRLLYCHDRPQDELCFVKIVPFRTDSGTILKTLSLTDQAYAYTWNTGETSSEILVTEQGHYCVEVKDSSGCQARDCINIRIHKDCETKIEMDRLGISTSLTGYTLMAHSKGQGPFTFQWSTGDTTRRIFVQDTGLYYVDVVDSNGCLSSDTFNIKPYCQTKIHLANTDLNTVAAPTLMARTFGHPPFAYLWSSGDTTQTISGDYDAEYCVTVTDALGCTSEDCALFPSDRFCKTEIQINPNSIAAQAGLRLVARTKGHGPFKYLWSTQDTSKSIPIVNSVTNYCVTVTDITGCLSNTCIDLEDLMDQCKVSIIRRSPNQIMAVPQGIPPFKYLWNNGSEANQIKIDSAGSYCVEMEDALSCISSACIEIKENDLPSLCNVRIKAVRIGHGEIKLIVQTPGNADYKIEWDNGANTPSIVINDPGTYCVTVSNAFCKAETCITLDPNQNINEGIGKVIGRDQITTQKAFINLGPNPFKDELFLRLETGSPGNILLKIYGLDGRIVKKERIEVVPGINEQFLDMHHLQGGIYIVQVIGDTWQNSYRVIKQP